MGGFLRRMTAWPILFLCFSVLREKSVFCKIQKNYIDRWISVLGGSEVMGWRMTAYPILFLCFCVLREKAWMGEGGAGAGGRGCPPVRGSSRVRGLYWFPGAAAEGSCLVDSLPPTPPRGTRHGSFWGGGWILHWAVPYRTVLPHCTLPQMPRNRFSNVLFQ